jgi:predicted phosphoribosyltransferase|uniref:hypothetical protein n=1 Tax=Enterocloster aldenensis TaxID=358742 RepID=UPI002E78C181
MAMDFALHIAQVINGYANWQWLWVTHIYLPDTEEMAFGAVGKRSDYLFHDGIHVPLLR